MMHLSIRSRYKLILLCTAIIIFRFFLPYGRDGSVDDDISVSINSILRLSARICKAGGNSWQKTPTPFKDEKRPPPFLQHADSSRKNGEGDMRYRPSKTPGNQQLLEHQILVPSESLEKSFFSWRSQDKPPAPKPPYKPPHEKGPPIQDPFPLLSKNLSPFYKKLLEERTRSPTPHPDEDTPLFIGFTRNWPQLIQCVVSYIAAGWPAEDIYVVENTGVMYANRDGKLTLQNPFYLNHTQLEMLGVNVIVTPTLLSFAQLQNFYAWTALDQDWSEYFWSHQDVMVFSYEDEDDDEDEAPTKNKAGKQKSVHDSNTGPSNIYSRNSKNSLYRRAHSVLQFLRHPSSPKWANHFFAYDQLTLVNRDATLEVGGWDTHIPYYATDCDMYVRLMWAGYWQGSTQIGIVLDVADVLDDVGALLRIPGIHASFRGDPGPPLEEQAWWIALNSAVPPSPESNPEYPLNPNDPDKDTTPLDSYESSHTPFSSTPQSKFLHEMDRAVRIEKAVDRYGETFTRLVQVAIRMENAKYAGGNNGQRNAWQGRQSGGEGEPFYRDSGGFERGVKMMIDTGRSVFAEKWGHRGCDISRMGIRREDAWRLERDWDFEAEGWGFQGGDW